MECGCSVGGVDVGGVWVVWSVGGVWVVWSVGGVWVLWNVGGVWVVWSEKHPCNAAPCQRRQVMRSHMRHDPVRLSLPLVGAVHPLADMSVSVQL